MSTIRALRDYVNMKEEDFASCFDKIDMELFKKDPTEAAHQAGIVTKPGVSFVIIEDKSKIDALPSNVYPFILSELPQDNLSLDDLDKVAGGGLIKSIGKINKAIVTKTGKAVW